MTFDTIIKPLDSYWHKKFESVQREQKRVESFLNHSEAIREAQEKELAALGKKAEMQQQTISAFEEELKKKNELVETLQRQLGEYQQRCMKADRENRSLQEKLESARRSLAQEYDNRDRLMEGLEELQKELADYRALSRRLQEDLDARDAMITRLSDECHELRAGYQELRAEYEAFLREDGGR